MAAEDAFSSEQKELVHSLRTERKFLGHPRAVGTLSIMQLCNSFANYTMSSLLVFYLYASVADGGLGLSQTDAAQLISLYSAISILAGLVGSYVADRILGPRRGLRFARCFMAVAYVVLAIPGTGIAGYAASQVMLVFSTMLAGRSLEALAGKMYEDGDSRRDGAFAITYTISQIGAAVPAIAGAISLIAGYHAAFALGAAAAVVGAVCYVLTEKKFFGPIGLEPDDPLPADSRVKTMGLIVGAVVVAVALLAFLFLNRIVTISQFANTLSTAAIFIPIVYLVYIIKSKKTTHAEGLRVKALVPLYACTCLTALVWTQSTTVLAIYTEQNVDLYLFGMEISPATFQTVPAIFAFIFGSVVTALWTKLGKHQPSNPWKVGFGTIMYGLGPVFMCLPFLLYPAGVKVSPMWLVVFYALIMIGEALASPTGYAAASMVAPKAFSTQMMTVWSLVGSTGAGLSTLAANFYTPGNEVMYFLVMGGITIVGGLLLMLVSKKLNVMMGQEAA